MTIEPFEFVVSPVEVDKVLERVLNFDWSLVPDLGWAAGIERGFLQRVCEHWATEWSWSTAHERLLRHRHFTAQVDGQTVQFVHELPDERVSPVPILLLHGWPASYHEYDRVVDRLTTAGYEVIVPSLPGYAFSSPLVEPSGPRAIAAQLNHLMTEHLGFDRYVAHGGDIGAAVAGWLGCDHAQSCVAVHVNLLFRLLEGSTPTTPEELAWAERRQKAAWDGMGYHHQQTTRPVTLGIGLSDSPVGTAAWMLEKYVAWSQLAVPEDIEDVLSLDELVDIVMLYILTGTIASSTMTYYGSASEPSGFPHRLEVPVGYAHFHEAIGFPPPLSLVEQAYPIVQWLPMERGGHFPAYEAPDLLAGAVLTFRDHPSVVAATGDAPRRAAGRDSTS
ncbi:epoxide hydrolase 1 [Actinomadura madurae]|uniref:epoxide hydrolase family protein n=1 Tax=Actinomadura madurae TaxID=1993 RepID=UPI00399AB44D